MPPPGTATVSLLEQLHYGDTPGIQGLSLATTRQQLEVKGCDSVCNVVATALRKIGWHGVVTVLEPDASSVCAVQSSSTAPVYILQRWSERWKAFIDVESINEIKDGDKVSIISKPVGSPLKVI